MLLSTHYIGHQPWTSLPWKNRPGTSIVAHICRRLTYLKLINHLTLLWSHYNVTQKDNDTINSFHMACDTRILCWGSVTLQVTSIKCLKRTLLGTMDWQEKFNNPIRDWICRHVSFFYSKNTNKVVFISNSFSLIGSWYFIFVSNQHFNFNWHHYMYLRLKVSPYLLLNKR